MLLKGNGTIHASRKKVRGFLTDRNRIGLCAPSAADVISEMTLNDGPGDTTPVHWTADVKESGYLASLVSRLMVPASQKLAGVFYDVMRKRIEMEGVQT